MATATRKRQTQRWTPDAIQELRFRYRMTQTEAAARVGTTQNLWSLWENGRFAPSPRYQKLLELLAAGKLRNAS